jgi:hypothetical protein
VSQSPAQEEIQEADFTVWEEFLAKPARQHIETVFGELSRLFSRKIHASHAKRLGVEDRLLPIGLLDSVLIGGNSGFFRHLPVETQ